MSINMEDYIEFNG